MHAKRHFKSGTHAPSGQMHDHNLTFALAGVQQPDGKAQHDMDGQLSCKLGILHCPVSLAAWPCQAMAKHEQLQACYAHVARMVFPTGPHWRQGNRKWQQSREGSEECV